MSECICSPGVASNRRGRFHGRTCPLYGVGGPTLHDFATWCDDEYRRLAARPHRGDTTAQHAQDGAMAMLAELGCALRSGTLPQHSACRAQWLMEQAKEAAHVVPVKP